MAITSSNKLLAAAIALLYSCHTVTCFSFSSQPSLVGRGNARAFAGGAESSKLFSFSSSSLSTRSSSESKSALYMASWSDSRAVQDYQNFLASGKQELDLKQDVPSVIVKSADPTLASDYSDLVECFVQMGMGNDIVLTPDQTLPPEVEGAVDYPIYIALPPWEIEDFLRNLSDSFMAKNANFVFFAGGLKYGNIEDVLKERGYCRDTMTQVLISGMRIKPATKRPEDIRVNLGPDTYGETKWSGGCTACGLWNGAVAERLQRSTVMCDTDFYREWRRKMWERSVMDAVFLLLGSVRSTELKTTLADVALYYGDEASDIVWEMSQLLRGWKAITLMYGFEERLFSFAEKRGKEEPCILKNEMYPFIWGNFVYLQSKTYVEYLQYAQDEIGLLPGIELPERRDDDYKSKMRQGNLRADGVI